MGACAAYMEEAPTVVWPSSTAFSVKFLPMLLVVKLFVSTERADGMRADGMLLSRPTNARVAEALTAEALHLQYRKECTKSVQRVSKSVYTRWMGGESSHANAGCTNLPAGLLMTTELRYSGRIKCESRSLN